MTERCLYGPEFLRKTAGLIPKANDERTVLGAN